MGCSALKRRLRYFQESGFVKSIVCGTPAPVELNWAAAGADCGAGGGGTVLGSRPPRFFFFSDHFQSPLTSFPCVSEGLGTQRVVSRCLRIACHWRCFKEEATWDYDTASSRGPFSRPIETRVKGGGWMAAPEKCDWRARSGPPGHGAADGVWLSQAQTARGAPNGQERRSEPQNGASREKEFQGSQWHWFKVHNSPHR